MVWCDVVWSGVFKRGRVMCSNRLCSCNGVVEWGGVGFSNGVVKWCVQMGWNGVVWWDRVFLLNDIFCCITRRLT